MSLTVLEPGLHTILVDHGRPRTRHLGVPLGGAADLAALAIANALVGNSPDAVALEVTMNGPTLRAECPISAVIFGAPFLAAIGGKRRIEPGYTFTLDAGDVIKIGGTPRGVRAYFCVTGGFDVPAVLGSRSSLKPIDAGDQLPCTPGYQPARGLGFASFPAELSDETVLRALPGGQYSWFLQPQEFWNKPYTILPASNRMGVRLRGAGLERKPGELISEAVAPGAVQVTNDGQPILLGVDGQTIGGYPKIAHVIRADLDRMAQLRPGGKVRFQPVTPVEAQQAWREYGQSLNPWLLRLELTASVKNLEPRL